MVSFWRGNYIFINRGPGVVVVDIAAVIDDDVDATHDVRPSSRYANCEPNRQTDRRMNAIAHCVCECVHRLQPDNVPARHTVAATTKSSFLLHFITCLSNNCLEISIWKMLSASRCRRHRRRRRRHCGMDGGWCVRVCASDEIGEWENGRERTMEIILCTCARSFPPLVAHN